jgi:hypothetical protein
METRIKSLILNSVVYGLILGAVYVVLSLIYYILSVDIFKPGISILILLIQLAILIAAMIIGTNRCRDKYLQGKINFGLAFLSCVIIGFIGFIISGIYSFIFYKYFDPQLLVQMHDRALEMFQNMPNIPQERMDKIMQRMEKNLTPTGMIISSIKMAVIGSIIFALIISLFIKKEKESAAINIE